MQEGERMHHKVTAALVAVLALAAASCGSSKQASTAAQQTTTTTTTPKPLHQSAFAASVDAVCQRTAKGIAVLLKESEHTDVATRRAKAVALVRAEVSSLETLTAPAKLRADYALYRGLIRSRLADLTESPAASRRKPARSNAQEQVQTAKERAARRHIGLSACF
jgi:hypothetical protein